MTAVGPKQIFSKLIIFHLVFIFYYINNNNKGAGVSNFLSIKYLAIFAGLILITNSLKADEVVDLNDLSQEELEKNFSSAIRL